MRGDHACESLILVAEAGTPPRARGSLHAITGSDTDGRNTPACAGITISASPCAQATWEHPRVRGDHRPARARAAVQRGTPPRARGSRCASPRPRRPARNTPACAGITRSVPRRPPGRWEHPRVRGDHLAKALGMTREEGTPPRARGSLFIELDSTTGSGNTPACAGITCCCSNRQSSTMEHPRVRGDHPLPADTPDEPNGTPPRARGSPRAWRCKVMILRNTPACAGITVARRSKGVSPPEHPRVRGDH